MIFFNNIIVNNVLLYLYLFLYNITLISLFLIIFSSINKKNKTLYSFNKLNLNSFKMLLFTIILFSLAGVPPFIGFFSKLFILNLLLNFNLFIFYFLFFILLLLGLYFYVQTIRFVHSSNYKSETNITFLYTELTNYYYYTYNLLFIYLAFFGFFFIDDLILIFC